MKQKRNISSKMASKNSKYLSKLNKGKKKSKSIIINIKTGKKNKDDDLKNDNKVDTKKSKLDQDETKSNGRPFIKTQIEPYHSLENSKNKVNNDNEKKILHPLRTINSAKSFGVDKSKYLTNKNPSTLEESSSYLKKVSFADENLQSYQDYNTYQSHQYYPQRYFPRPPLPARNECKR